MIKYIKRINYRLKEVKFRQKNMNKLKIPPINGGIFNIIKLGEFDFVTRLQARNTIKRKNLSSVH